MALFVYRLHQYSNNILNGIIRNLLAIIVDWVLQALLLIQINAVVISGMTRLEKKSEDIVIYGFNSKVIDWRVLQCVLF